LIRRRTVVPIAGLCLVALTAGACSANKEATAAPAASVKPPVITLPSKLLGLDVSSQDITKRLQEQGDQPYIDSVGLFAFREGKDLLDATLQVARFTKDADAESSRFRGSIVARIGGANPQNVHVGEQEVFLTSGRNQVVFLWFKKRGFFVLTVRRTYLFPRTILRRLIDMNLSL